MGWYKEYLQDLAEIQAEKDARGCIGCLIVGVVIAIVCGVLAGVIYIKDEFFYTPAPVEFKKPEPGYTPQQTPAKSSYLDAIDHINSNVELGLFYYDIANKFHDKKWV